MSFLSPVGRAKLCGHLGRYSRWQRALDGEDAWLFSTLMRLGCGAPVTMGGCWVGEVVALGRMEDLYQVEAVQGTVEEAILRQLTVESCGSVLEGCSRERAGTGGAGKPGACPAGV
jgi:hypothetical protein